LPFSASPIVPTLPGTPSRRRPSSRRPSGRTPGVHSLPARRPPGPTTTGKRCAARGWSLLPWSFGGLASSSPSTFNSHLPELYTCLVREASWELSPGGGLNLPDDLPGAGRRVY